MKKLLLFILLISNFLNAQVLETFPSTLGLKDPSNFINFNNKMFFLATDASYEYSLFAADGTSGNAEVVKKLGFAFVNGIKESNQFNEFKIVFNNKLYFNFSNTFYQSDGTTAGTNVFSSTLKNVRHFKIFNNRLYFIAQTNTSGQELWSTDGTAAGTTLLKDIYPGTSSAFNFYLYNPFLTLFNNKLFFVANDGVHGYELWSTDGTEAGTALFKDIRINETSTTDFGAFVFGGYVNSGHLENLKYPNFAVVGNKMYFGANPQVILANSSKPDAPILYETDGTATGTVIVQPTATGDFNYFYDIRGLTAINNKLFFSGTQVFNPSSAGGFGVYVIDGANPVTLLKDFLSVAGDVGTSDEIQRNEMRSFNGECYFLGKRNESGDQVNLWKMNPTNYSFTKLTQAINSSNAEFAESGLQLLVAREFKNSLYFVKTKDYAGKIFSTDGSSSGTQFVAKLSSSSTASTTQVTQAMSVIPSALFSFNSSLYFNAQFGYGQPTGLWRLNFSTLANSSFSKNENDIYPNPTSGILNITATDNLKSITAFDLLGKQIFSKNILSNTAEVDFSNFNSGVYFIKIQSEKGVIETKKIIKK